MRPGSPCRELALFADLLWATGRGKWGSHSFLSRCQTRWGWNIWWGSDTQPYPRPVANLELCLLATTGTILVQGKALVWCPSSCMVPGLVLDGSGPRAQALLVLVLRPGGHGKQIYLTILISATGRKAGVGLVPQKTARLRHTGSTSTLRPRYVQTQSKPRAESPGLWWRRTGSGLGSELSSTQLGFTVVPSDARPGGSHQGWGQGGGQPQAVE